jgi:hypothetical protein
MSSSLLRRGVPVKPGIAPTLVCILLRSRLQKLPLPLQQPPLPCELNLVPASTLGSKSILNSILVQCRERAVAERLKRWRIADG